MLHLDCETTGFGAKTNDILSVSVVDKDLNVLFTSYVKPVRQTSWKNAMEVHGITPDMVKDAPSRIEVGRQLYEVVKGHEVCAYNAEFDIPFVGLLGVVIPMTYAHCCMHRFAKYMGIPSSKAYHRGFLTHKLNVAAEVTKYVYQQSDKLHDASTDAKICAHVWNFLNAHYGTTDK